MPLRFLHCADIHLGYQQYNEKERFNDFGRAFYAVVDKALGKAGEFDPQIQGKVDFVILAGDLFQKRAIDALTLNQAMRGLERLAAAGIPCIAVEGNHERAYYDETIGWMKFLALQGLLILLDAPFVEGGVQLQPWDARRRLGSYIDLPGGVRVHGLRYYGASTGQALQTYAQALAELPPTAVNYTIFVAHAGVEGQIDAKAGGLSLRQWAPLRPHVDYLALGHFHKPFQLDGWIYNPGSPENCSIAETDWPARGYLVVEIHTERPPGDAAPRHTVTQGVNPRRAARLYNFKTDHVTTPEELLERLRAFLARRAVELAEEVRQGAYPEVMPPIIELLLTGVLPFERSALNLGDIEALVKEIFQPLVALVKNLTQPAAFAVAADAGLSRAELEHQVLASLFGRDARFAANSARWASLTVDLKTLALGGASAAAIVDELAAHLAQMEGQPHADSAG